MANSRKVLVIGDDTRSFLATVRSLGRKGIEVHVAPYDLGAPALRSKYIRRIHRLPYYLDGGERWLAAVVAVCREHQFDLIIPCEERALLPLFRHRGVLEDLCRLAIPDTAALAAFFDKFATRELAMQAGVPVPSGRLLSPADTPTGLIAEFSLPLVLKHRKSYDWPEIYVRRGAFVIESTQELERWLNANSAGPDDIFVEEFWPGLGGGLSVLCDKGEVLLAFEHQRAHEVTGSSFYRHSAALDTSRLEAVTAMTRRIAYTGLAMFEFKLNSQSGEWRLLEVNARPWGSMPLPVALGVDFPYGLYRLLVEGAKPAPCKYRTGVYGRNFIPDLWQLRSTLQQTRGRPFQGLKTFAAWLWEFRRLLAGNEHQDLWVLDDHAPAIAELRQFAGDRLASLRTSLLGATPISLSAERKRFQASVRSQGGRLNILFLCQGNICRSPYAELKLRQLMPADALAEVSSAGLLPRNARASPTTAQAAALQRGVDLSTHRSRHAHAEVVDAATHILIFDDVNLRSFIARCPELRERVFFLSSLNPNESNHEILDPDGCSASVFEKTYSRIDRCLECLSELVQRQA